MSFDTKTPLYFTTKPKKITKTQKSKNNLKFYKIKKKIFIFFSTLKDADVTLVLFFLIADVTNFIQT